MKTEIQTAIFKDYAELLELGPRGYVPEPTDSRLMRQMIWCRSGWAPLIRDFLDELRAMGAVERGFRITSVKQKFGALSMSGNDIWPEVRLLMRKYAERSQHICEWCGEPGELRNEGFIQTAFDTHVDTYEELEDRT